MIDFTINFLGRVEYWFLLIKIFVLSAKAQKKCYKTGHFGNFMIKLPLFLPTCNHYADIFVANIEPAPRIYRHADHSACYSICNLGTRVDGIRNVVLSC